MEHPYHEILLSNKKEGTSDIHKDMSEFPGNSTEGKEPLSSTTGFHLCNKGDRKNYKS